MKKGIIYKYTSPNNKCYIGQTINEDNRKNQHRSRCWKENSHFYRAIRKYGWNNFKYEILFECNIKNPKRIKILLNEMEKYFIKKYDSFNNGYNSTLGGENLSKQKINSKIKQIAQYSSSGDLIKVWDSAIEIERTLNIKSLKITQSCKGMRGIVEGYKWKWIEFEN